MVYNFLIASKSCQVKNNEKGNKFIFFRLHYNNKWNKEMAKIKDNVKKKMTDSNNNRIYKYWTFLKKIYLKSNTLFHVKQLPENIRILPRCIFIIFEK